MDGGDPPSAGLFDTTGRGQVSSHDRSRPGGCAWGSGGTCRDSWARNGRRGEATRMYGRPGKETGRCRARWMMPAIRSIGVHVRKAGFQTGAAPPRVWRGGARKVRDFLAWRSSGECGSPSASLRSNVESGAADRRKKRDLVFRGRIIANRCRCRFLFSAVSRWAAMRFAPDNHEVSTLPGCIRRQPLLSVRDRSVGKCHVGNESPRLSVEAAFEEKGGRGLVSSA